MLGPIHSYRFIIMCIFFLPVAVIIATYRWIMYGVIFDWDYVDFFEDLMDMLIDGEESMFYKELKRWFPDEI